MSSTIGPNEPSYNEALLRVAKIIEESQRDLSQIKAISDASFREWLDVVLQRVCSSIGVGLAKARAFVEDVFTAMGNAGVAFKDAYKEAYTKSRRIKPRTSGH